MRCSILIVAVVDNVVFLIDRDIGMSVTNDAENVTKFIHKCLPNNRIVYRDTMGCWDELVHENGVFKDFRSWGGEIPDFE